ncbi:MAG TPA: tetratricopeptide repeat-containing protein [Anaerolineales bacterium]|nr:tetratricopeptide repeat-containing protein [Anaerolineales bacterium]
MQPDPPKEPARQEPVPPTEPSSPSQPTPVVKTLQPDKEPASPAIHPEVRPHAFVIMPFGKKKGADGSLYDFNAIYSQLIKPALETAGFEPFRADEETDSGDILTDMFQELLLADLCIADMSIDNANVFYELGIRHAFRKRGIVHIQAGRAYMPFDVFNVRTIPYHITTEGVPDPAFLEKDRAAISRVTRDTWASDMDAVHSPIFNLLDGLVEPDRRSLETPLATGFWREYNEWKGRLAVAERQKRIGDILLLSEEIRNPLIKEEAIGEAGLALKNMGRYELALTQYRKGLEVNARNLTFRREEAFSLNRLGKVDEAIVRIESLLADRPRDTETIAYLGRIYKEMWLESWKWIEDKKLRIRTAFDSYHWLLKSFQTYLRGYRLDLDEFYPGVNALTLGTIIVHLADQFEDQAQPDPEIQEVRELLSELRGSLVFALETKTKAENADYWAFISLGELLVLTAEVTQQVSRAYRKALTASRGNQFRLQSSLAQLEILRSLGMRGEFVQAGIDVISEELKRIRRDLYDDAGETGSSDASPQPEGMVFLFTGYMVDNDRKQENRFPPEMEDQIKAAVDAVLEKYHAGPDDLAVTTGMDAGSEILFVESCVARGVPVQAYFPLFEGPYVREFVSDGWQERFYKLRNDPLVNEFYQPDCVGLPREGDNVHERNNRWALYSALARGIDKVRLVALWDGKAEAPRDLDARLVKHMVNLMRDMGGIIEQINPTKLARPLESAPSGKASKKPATRKKK